jgi:hypothetical protein
MEQLTTADIDAICAADTSVEDARTALAAAQREIARLQRSLQDADDAHFIAGTLDADRYARTVARLNAEIANQRAAAARCAEHIEHDAERGGRRARLLDVLRNGAAILRSADPTAANVWLRQHVRVWVRDKALRDGEVLVLWL